ncbi:MAG: hypothetical protein ABFS39_15090 [Pseudomonadota bacterium]
MKTLTKTIIAASFCLVATVPAYAGHGHFNDRLIDRMERQHERIEDGIQSRELTRKETKILKRQQRRIRRLVREFREDGWLSKKERRILRNKFDRASFKIREFKHNDLNRYVDLHQRYGSCCDPVWDDMDRGMVRGKDKKHRTSHAW